MAEATAVSPNSVLPDELMIEILSRVDSSNHLELRCVCKLWKSLVLAPHFMNGQLLISTTDLAALRRKLTERFNAFESRIINSLPLPVVPNAEEDVADGADAEEEEEEENADAGAEEDGVVDGADVDGADAEEEEDADGDAQEYEEDADADGAEEDGVVVGADVDGSDAEEEEDSDGDVADAEEDGVDVDADDADAEEEKDSVGDVADAEEDGVGVGVDGDDAEEEEEDADGDFADAEEDGAGVDDDVDGADAEEEEEDADAENEEDLEEEKDDEEEQLKTKVLNQLVNLVEKEKQLMEKGQNLNNHDEQLMIIRVAKFDNILRVIRYMKSFMLNFVNYTKEDRVVSKGNLEAIRLEIRTMNDRVDSFESFQQIYLKSLRRC